MDWATSLEKTFLAGGVGGCQNGIFDEKAQMTWYGNRVVISPIQNYFNVCCFYCLSQ